MARIRPLSSEVSAAMTRSMVASGRDRAGPLDVEIGFDGVEVGAIGIVDAIDAGIVAVDDDLGRIGGKTEERAELIDEIDVDVGVVDDGDGLASAVDSLA